jgi:MFS family permease
MSTRKSQARPHKVVSDERKPTSSALHYRDFRLLWVGQIVSLTGSQMQFVAINWHVYMLTKSPLALGGLGLVRILPIMLCSLIAGVIADAVDRKRLMLVTQVVMLATAALLAIVTALGLQSLWIIYALTAIGSATLAFDNPARQALLPSLLPLNVFPNGVSLMSTAIHTSMVVGPAISGLLLGMYGAPLIYTINALSFLAIIFALLSMQASGRVIRSEGQISRVNLDALREGLRFVWRTPIIVQTMTIDFIATFFASSTTLLPIFAVDILRVGPQGLGFLSAAPALGSITASLAMSRLDILPKQGATMLSAIAIYGAATVGFGLSRWFWPSFAMLVVVGSADTVSTVLRQTIRQLVTPDYLRGRMTSVNMIFFVGGPQLGEFEAGTVAALIGAQLSVVTGGIACIVAAVLAALTAKTLLHSDVQFSEVSPVKQ